MMINCVKRYLNISTIIAVSLILLFLITGHSTPNDLDERAEEALEYCNKNGYSTEHCLLVDYGRHSGRVRFFLWDFEKEKPALKCLCAHGYGKGSTARRPVFSNVNGNEKCTDFGNWECTDFGNNNAPISVGSVN